MTWRQRAACRGMDTSLFYAERGDLVSIRLAKDVCDTCAVEAECLDVALGSLVHSDIGVWGGTTPKERRQIRAVSRVAA